jgi:hypothetical protein
MENFCLTIVHPHNVEAMWPEVGPWILQAVGEQCDTTDALYIKEQCIRGNATIFIVHKDERIEAVLVTEAAFYGGKRTLVLRWLSGSKRHAWLEFIHYVEDYAFTHGFERLELWGRKAWEREMRPYGFAHEYTVLGKFLTKRVH